MDSHDMHEWHVAVNEFSLEDSEHHTFMYEAMDAIRELPRLEHLFRAERLKQLPQVHQQWIHSEPEPLPNDRLTCCLGKICSECPYLLALEKADVPPDFLDKVKAYTCVSHIIMSGGDVMNEGYILTTSDQKFWSSLYESMTRDWQEMEEEE